MKVLVTGANGYIGRNLLAFLWASGHKIVALVRNKDSLQTFPLIQRDIEIIEGDLLHIDSLKKIPKNIDAAYYLIHSMKQMPSGFSSLENRCANNFVRALEKTNAKQLVYLGGLSKSACPSEHMISKKQVEKILQKGKVPVTIFRVGIVIGSGSASFEIIRDLVEKIPVMVAPRWVVSKCQPIAIMDLLFYLEKALDIPDFKGNVFELGGPDILTYKQIILVFAKIRGLKRCLFTVPFLTPYLSSLWLYLVTSTNFSLAKALVNSLTSDAICSKYSVSKVISHNCLNLEQAVRRSFTNVSQNPFSEESLKFMKTREIKKNEFINVPLFGVKKILNKKKGGISKQLTVDHLWKIGKKNGWYSYKWVWILRAWIDRRLNGVGLGNPRVDPVNIVNGQSLDFYRVLLADREKGRLILYAEMKLPGELWIEWNICEKEGVAITKQAVTFRPKGLFGRFYWNVFYLFRKYMFKKMLLNIVNLK